MRNGNLVLFVASALLNFGAVKAGPVPGQGTWETTLQARDLDKDGYADAFYDISSNLTWLGTGSTSMSWFEGNSWATSDHFGLGGWRLPNTNQPDTTCNVVFDPGQYGGFGCAGGELAHLFSDVLGNKSSMGPFNTGPFSNIQVSCFMAERYSPGSDNAWVYCMGFGVQAPLPLDHFSAASGTYAMAVRSGDVFAVPEPGSLGMTLAAMGVLAMSRRNRRRVANGSTMLE